MRNDHRLVILLAADAVNARDAGDHHDVAPREQRTHRREPHPLDFLVPAGILFDERVGARDVGFRLVIIEVADEVFDGVVGEKTFELGVKLRGQRLVVRNDQRGFVHVFDDVGDGEGLAGTGHAEERLVFRAGQNAVGQLRNRLRLVPGGFEGRDEFEHADESRTPSGQRQTWALLRKTRFSKSRTGTSTGAVFCFLSTLNLQPSTSPSRPF